MPLGLFLLPRPSGRDLVIPVFFFGGYLPQSSGFLSAKQILVASFASRVRTRVLGDRDMFCTLGEAQQRRGLMPLGLFLFFRVLLHHHFCMVTCPSPPVFARPNKYSSQISTIRLGFVS